MTISVIRDQLVFFFSSSQQWGPQDQIRGYVVQKKKKKKGSGMRVVRGIFVNRKLPIYFSVKCM